MRSKTHPPAQWPTDSEIRPSIEDSPPLSDTSEDVDMIYVKREFDWASTPSDGDALVLRRGAPKRAKQTAKQAAKQANRQRKQAKQVKQSPLSARFRVPGQPDVKMENDDDDAKKEDKDVNSDWDDYGQTPGLLEEYDRVLREIPGTKQWNATQKKIHKLIWLRGHHPVLPSWWRISFRMWGVTQGHLNHVFAPPGSKKRVAIHAYGNHVAASKALESLFNLTQTVKDYEELGFTERIGPTVVKGIMSYYKWAIRDAKLEKVGIFPTLVVKNYPPSFRRRLDPSSGTDPVDETFLTTAERQKLFTDAVTADIQEKLLAMGSAWRDILRDHKTSSWLMTPPTLFAIAVVQHLALLVTLDPRDEPKRPVVVIEQIRFNDRGLWLWNALSVAIAINMLRDEIYKLENLKLVADELYESSSDPDT
ncbi:hypothetical protein B0T22DRAFT_151844 [Podospora appendiculata]|uniref:Uncharacterized protein n=1 Tax=Podospora appendiculata TaxID=314037 RepID=A0AAE1CCD6_9PEZI|nr:hypothetical protein B0T22DRAFT_151844 [Podospora appendiculata]